MDDYRLNRGIQGIIIDSPPTVRRNDENTIDYPNGNSLEYHRDSGGKYIFDYHVRDRRIRLNDLVTNDQWIFYPVDSGFQVQWKENGYMLPEPEIQLSVVRGTKHSPGLEESEIAILSALHEIGHANHYNFLYDILNSEQPLDGERLDEVFPESLSGLRDSLKSRSAFPNARNLSEGIKNSILFFSYLFKRNNRDFRIANERFAWAYALRTARRQGLVDEFSTKELQDHYKKCLRSYGLEFL